ncbi:MAG: four helix bundle protein [Desulfobacterales bacterium]|nr:four helix bundle protein [Desulfobacterales bacterium]
MLRYSGVRSQNERTRKAEGFRKRGNLDKLRFLNIAQGSLEESRYYLILTPEY